MKLAENFIEFLRITANMVTLVQFRTVFKREKPCFKEFPFDFCKEKSFYALDLEREVSAPKIARVYASGLSKYLRSMSSLEGVTQIYFARTLRKTVIRYTYMTAGNRRKGLRVFFPYSC